MQIKNHKECVVGMRLVRIAYWLNIRRKLKNVENKYQKESDNYSKYADVCLNCGMKLHVPEKYCPNCGKIMDSWKEKI